MNKKYLIFIVHLIFLLSISNIANAQSQNFSITSAYNWLNTTINDRVWNGQVDEVSLVILALSTGNYNVADGINKLKSMQSEDGSWNNNVYDTSWATYALYKTNNDISKSVKWLLDRQVQAITTGNWLVQIKTTNPGSCSVALGGNEEVVFNVNSEGVSCDFDGNGDGFGSWIDLESCARLKVGSNDTLAINCNNLGNADLSLIYKLDNNYYILNTKTNSKYANFEIENTNLGDYEGTEYGTWVLTEVGKKELLHTWPYLKTNLREDILVDRALLLLISNNIGESNSNYAEFLRERQNNFTGYWDDGNVFNTAFITFALKKDPKSSDSTKSAIDWLEGEQNSRQGSTKYGSWNNDMRDTSMVIYAIASSSSTTTKFKSNYCGDKIVNGAEECDAVYSSNGSLKDGDASKCQSNEKCANPRSLNECKCKLQTQVECTKNEDCNSLEECINKQCELKQGYCKSSSQCNQDEECDIGTNKCKSKTPECTADKECGPGLECSSGKCNAIPGYCASDDPCESGQKCNKKTNRCEKKSFPFWIISLILILVLGALFFFIKKKGGIKFKLKKEEPLRPKENQLRPTFIPKQTQTTPIRPPERSYMDDRLESELDKSIKKAKELIGKK